MKFRWKKKTIKLKYDAELFRFDQQRTDETLRVFGDRVERLVIEIIFGRRYSRVRFWPVGAPERRLAGQSVETYRRKTIVNNYR